MNVVSIAQENVAFEGTRGISRNNQDLGFQPAFLNKQTGQVELSRLKNGQPAAMHLISYLPGDWAESTDHHGCITQLNANVIAGFCRDGIFYTRAEVAEL